MRRRPARPPHVPLTDVSRADGRPLRDAAPQQALRRRAAAHAAAQLRADRAALAAVDALIVRAAHAAAALLGARGMALAQQADLVAAAAARAAAARHAGAAAVVAALVRLVAAALVAPARLAGGAALLAVPHAALSPGAGQGRQGAGCCTWLPAACRCERCGCAAGSLPNQAAPCPGPAAQISLRREPLGPPALLTSCSGSHCDSHR